MRMLHKLGGRNYFSEISFLLIFCLYKIQKGGIIRSKDGGIGKEMAMKLITKIRKADSTKKTKIWQDADLMGWEAEELVKEMILSLPGHYRIHNRQYGTNLVDKIFEVYGWMPSMFVDEKMMMGLQALYPKKVYASFTLGLDVVEVKK